jgi:hypothetical protein
VSQDRNHAVRRILWILGAAALAMTPIALVAQSPPASDPKAVAIADQVMGALGGWAAWDQTRFLRFDFAVDHEGKTVASRAHTWDKHSGRYRLEGKTKEGDPFVVLMNINTKDGTAWRKGTPVEGEEKAKLLESGFGAWTNDTYWLLMPYKMRDPGVVLAYDGEQTAGGDTWDKLLLTFNNVGLTPKDKYWVFVNRKTHMVDRWDFILKGGEGPPSSFQWKDWKSYGGIKLAPERVNTKDGTRIYFPVLEVPANVPDKVFTSPEPVTGG